MSWTEKLDELTNKFYEDPEEHRTAAIEAMAEMHENSLLEGLEEFRAFSKEAVGACGGAYIPFVFWTELSTFIDDGEDRSYLTEIVRAFVNSDFEQVEQKRMRALLITYFAMEREFEVNKLIALVVEKAHPTVQEYFQKVRVFVSKNKTSVDMYQEKFRLLKDYAPDFDLLKMPVSKLKATLEEIG